MDRPNLEHKVVMAVDVDPVTALNQTADGWTPWWMMPSRTPEGQPALAILCYRVASPIIKL